ncbi:SKI2 subunit of superkiller complex protein [Octopus bimaculoides]|uniref:SKI2 subunit of superkiller complex protein n=1 Tax=Octopus bimaculoides TaxID=37653 RepID=UPI00071DF1B8|nr:SKI2 subunit of superkiller complex protein [Octopus bimaculoides]|eukprot:XP_014780595.1 PREDICTED: helicase SKI2W-like [Octopus bimaculoides]
MFDLLETGTCGRVEVIPEQNRNANRVPLPLKTLPFGLPKILPTWKKDLEKYVEHPESLPIHDFKKHQKYWPRTKHSENLLEMDVTPVQTTITVERNPTTGKLLGYQEELLTNTMSTIKNSMSFKRPPGPPTQDVRGCATNYPFWPGGMDKIPSYKGLIAKGKYDVIDFEKNLLYNAPGLKAGMDYDGEVPKEIPAAPEIYVEKESDEPVIPLVEAPSTTEDTGKEKAASPPPKEVSDENKEQQPPPAEDSNKIETAKQYLKLTDLFAPSDDLLSDDQFQFRKPTKEHIETETVNTKTTNISRSESLEELVKVKEEKPETPAAPKPEEEKEVWAVNIDTKTPVDDFYKRIPVMAYKWPFELDIFQKQAILRLENHESVFVAAHTSAGKTVIAEYAIASSLRHLTRTVYTSPIKALSNQKFRDFKQKFGDVGLITGDVQLNQTASCLIMTTEILRSMLYNGSDIIRDLEWVIFDEVHYINDSERGVVWEEVLIMLPQTVNIILLSATVPNTIEFAGWVGKTKKRKLYVISTSKRPVPLEHYLYTGNSSKTANELFTVLDAKGVFQETGVTQAIAAKKKQPSTEAKRPNANVTAKQEKNVWLSVIDMLKKKDKLPVVAFMFSRKRIDANAANLLSVDLTTSSEKSEIHVFYQKCVMRLKGSDRDLPQVKQMEELLKRGLGIHHSGVLPILKEVVEMLFQRSLVKILFATETFAMGVNMPARTVLFDSISKHDGTNFRNLLPGEYIQMAGRAGRRGLDTTGTVIIMCKAGVPQKVDLHRMMLTLLFTSPASNKVLSNGRVVVIDKADHPNTAGIVLQSMNNLKNEKLYGILVLCEKNDNEPLQDSNHNATEKEDENKSSDLRPMLPKPLFLPEGPAWHKLLKVSADAIDYITSKTIKIDPEKIINNIKKRNMPRFRDEPPSQSVSVATQELLRLSETNPNGMTKINMIKDLNIRDIDQMEKCRSIQYLETQIAQYNCVNCPHFMEHFKQVHTNQMMKKKYKKLSFLVSDASLSLLPEYQQRIEVLKSFKYLNQTCTVQLKGRVACEISNHELMITELILNNIFTQLQPAEIAATLSCVVFEVKHCSKPELTSVLKKCRKQVLDIAASIAEKQKEFGITISVEEYQESFHFGLMEVVYEWARGMPFSDITELTDVQEGIIVRCIQRLNEVLMDVRNAARLIGDPVLCQKMEEASTLIKRDIVFTASLYTQE